MKSETIEVVWARSRERVWPIDDERIAADDPRTLRERLDIPRDTDPVETMPAPKVREAADGPTFVDRHRPGDEIDHVEFERGPVDVVADRLLETEGAMSALVTDATDPDLANRAAEALVAELADRGVDAAHLHVGPPDPGTPQLSGPPSDVDHAVENLIHDGRSHTLATGAVEPTEITEAIEHLAERFDRVLVTGTGTGIDRRQSRLAEHVDVIIIRDDHHMVEGAYSTEFADQPTPVIAVLSGIPRVDEEPPSTSRALAGALVGLVLAVALAGVGWLVYRSLTDDDSAVAPDPATDVTTAPSTAAAPTEPDVTAGPASTVPPATTAPPATTGGGLNLGLPGAELLAAPTITIGADVAIAGAVRSEATATRIRGAAAALADGTTVDDQLVVDPTAVAWDEVRLEGPLSGLRDDAGLSLAGQRWADGVVALVRGPRARVLLDGGSGSGPRTLAALLSAELIEAGFDPVQVTISGPGDPPQVLLTTVRGRDV